MFFFSHTLRVGWVGFEKYGKFHPLLFWTLPLFHSILSFQVEKKNQLFFHRMCTLFLLDNQVYFILSTIIWCKFWRKMFLYLGKYSYKLYKWIFTWNSKLTNSFWKEKCKKRKMKESMSQSCHFHDFHSITHSKTYFIIEIKPLLVLIDD